jgi:predicted ATP-binding protein involved in virulence
VGSPDLRQVIVNTHSPAVVGEVEDDDILIAELKEELRRSDGARYRKLSFSCLSNTWRAGTGDVPIAQSGAFLTSIRTNSASGKLCIPDPPK